MDRALQAPGPIVSSIGEFYFVVSPPSAFAVCWHCGHRALPNEALGEMYVCLHDSHNSTIAGFDPSALSGLKTEATLWLNEFLSPISICMTYSVDCAQRMLSGDCCSRIQDAQQLNDVLKMIHRLSHKKCACLWLSRSCT